MITIVLVCTEVGVRLLALDGGGIRGLILIQVLLAIEQALGGVPLVHCIDWLAGTSTGGILALGLASGKHSLVFYCLFFNYIIFIIFTGKSLLECQCIYFRLKEQVFKGKRPYNSEPLEKILQYVLGEHTVMTEIKHPK